MKNTYIDLIIGRERLAKFNPEKSERESYIKASDEEFRPYASFLYTKREIYPNIEQTSRETYELIKDILTGLGYDIIYIRRFFRNHMSILTKTKDEIITRFAIFNRAGMNEDVVLKECPWLLWQYTEESLYLATFRMRVAGLQIDKDSIREYTYSKNNTLEGKNTQKLVQKTRNIYAKKQQK